MKVASLQQLTPFINGFTDEIEKIAGLRSWASGKAGKVVVDGITENPANRARAQKFVRDAAWDGVKDGVKRNAGKLGLAGGAMGIGAMAMHHHGKQRRQQDREQLLQDLASRIKTANLSGAATTVSDIKSTIPRNTMKSAPKYSKVNSDMSESPSQRQQPVLSPPPVRG